jgi:hypothetical protein
MRTLLVGLAVLVPVIGSAQSPALEHDPRGVMDRSTSWVQIEYPAATGATTEALELVVTPLPVKGTVVVTAQSPRRTRRIELLLDGQIVATCPGAQCVYVWQRALDGEHRVEARRYAR